MRRATSSWHANSRPIQKSPTSRERKRPCTAEMLLRRFGEASLRSGSTPGQKEFDEARQALEAAVSERPNYPSSQLALGKLYLLNGQTADAIVHLEEARALSPGNAAVYSNLAAAYRKQG